MRILAAVSIGLIACLCVGARADTPSISDTHSDLYKWFDGLGFDAVRTGRFVRVKWQIDRFSSTRYRYGFEDRNGSFLSIELERPPPGVTVSEIEPADLVKFANQRLRDYGPPQRRIIDLVELFVSTRACEARGFGEIEQSFQHLLAHRQASVATAILRWYEATGAPLDKRVHAAEGLIGLLPSVAESVLTLEWQKSLEAGGFTVAGRSTYLRDDQSLGIFIRPLVWCCTEKTLGCLGRVFDYRSASFRREVVQTLLQVANSVHSQAIGEAIEKILVKAIFDETFASPQPGMWTPTVGDLACLALSRYFPKKYEIEKFMFRVEREEVANNFKRLWMESNGEPTQPILGTRGGVDGMATDMVSGIVMDAGGNNDHSVADLVKSMWTKTLTVDNVGALLKTCCGAQVGKGRSTYITIAREGSGNGVTIRIALDKPSLWPGSDRGLEGMVEINGEGRISGGIDESRFEQSAWVEPIKQCLKSDGNTPFTIRFTLNH